MRRLIAIGSLAICGLLPAARAVQPPSQWRVVSSAALDSRIGRQFRSLALRQHADIRFDREGRTNAPLPPIAGRLSFHIESARHSKAWEDELSGEAQGASVPLSSELAAEGYILRIDSAASGSVQGITIRAATSSGLHNALLRIPDLLAVPPSRLATDLIPRPQSVHSSAGSAQWVIADYPSFPIRGVVEGFYGQPWSHADRLDILRFEGEHGMNLYLYGPKDDPYHRRLWREPYPPEQLKRLGELARTARANFVNFSFAVSPGLSMTYSSDADFQALRRKLDSVRKLGVTDFALFLDDVPQDMVHPEDRASFHSLAQAHIQLIHRVYDYLRALSPSYHLTICPTTCTNEWGSRDYIRELGAGLRPEIPIDWTGTEVIPPAITVEQARQWGENLHRKPLVWDNYPTGDGNNAMPNIDPLRGRDPGLFTAVSGLFSNPMNQAQLTLFPLETVSDYLWNATAYNPRASQTHAIASQYGKDAPALLGPLLEMFAADGKARANLTAMFEQGWGPIDAPGAQSQIDRLRSLLASLEGQPHFAKLVPELNPIADGLTGQLNRLRTSDAFNHLPDGRLEWNRAQEMLSSSPAAAKPVQDGDFAKWESRHPFLLNRKSQISDGQKLWKGPGCHSPPACSI